MVMETNTQSNMEIKKDNKIFKYILIGLVVVIVVGGIGTLLYFGINKLTAAKVTCSSSADSGGIKIEQKYDIGYEKDTVTNVTVTKKFEYSDKTQFDAFKSVVVPGTDSNMTDLENNNIKFESSVKGQAYSYTLEVNVKSASKDDVTATGLNKSLKELKTSLEGQGLVCK